MPHRIKATVAIMGIALLGCTLLCWAQEQTATSQPAASAPAGGGTGPKARCDKPVYEFETAWSGSSISHDYEIHNDGDQPLEILEVKTTCGCTVAKYDKVIAPGQVGKVTLTLKTSAVQESKTSKKAFVQTNDPNNKMMSLTIEGTVKPRIAIDPMVGADFQTVTENKEQTRKVTITNHTDKPMKLEPDPSPAGKNDVFSAAVKEVEPGKVFEVTVTAKPPFREGYNFASLRFLTGVPDQPDVSIHCRLQSPAIFEVSPPTVALTLPLTNDFRRTILLRYNGRDTAKIESVTCANAQVKLELKETEPGKVWQLDVSLPAGFDAETDQIGDIVVKTNVQTRPERNIPIIARRLPSQTRPAELIVAAEQLLGRPAPAAQLRSPEGRPIELNPSTGVVTVLNFWASWSALSRQQLPLLQELRNRFAREGVNFVNVSMDRLTPPSEVTEAIRSLNVSMPIALDSQHEVAAKYGVEGPPTLFLIGKQGRIEAIHKGLPEADAERKAYQDRLAVEIDALLAGKTRLDFPPGAAPGGRMTPADALIRRPPIAGEQVPRLTLESLELDTGKHRPGQEATYSVYCRNDGSRPLTIHSVSASEGLSVDPGYTRVLRPGLSTALRCTFKAPAKPETVSHRLKITSDDPVRREVDVTLIVNARPYLEVNPVSGIDFGSNPRTQGMSRMATITYNGDGEIEYTAAKSSSPEFTAKVEKILQGPSAKVIVDAKQPLSVGEHKAIITVETTCREQPTVDIPVYLRRPDRIEVAPAEVVLDAARRLQKASVAINNNGMEPLHILGVERSNPAIRTQFYPEPDGFSYKLELTVPASVECGPDGEKITIRTDDKEHATITIPIRRGPSPSQHAVSSK